MMTGPQPFQWNFNGPNWQMGPLQNPVNGPPMPDLAQIQQQRAQQGAAQQAPPDMTITAPDSPSAQQQRGSGIQDVAGMMGWKPDPKASAWDNHIAAFSHVFSSLGLG